MRKSLIVLVAAMTVAMTVPAFAELQNVQVGGELRIRGSWYSEGLTNSFDNNTPGQVDSLFVEQRTKVNVSADFTDDVHAFIELDSWHIWGDGFRGLDVAGGNYALTGFDATGSGPAINLYQAYVEMKEAWGYPIYVKIGRSEMQHGDEFLIGNNDTSSLFRGLSFDGVWFGYKNDKFNIGGFWTRPYTDVSSFVGFGDGSADINFSGIYGSYTGIENMSIDGYYYYYQGSAINPTVPGADRSQAFSTVGARFAGNRSQFDWAANAAYQFGDTGSNTVKYDAFAMQATGGYTFDVKMQPHLFLNGEYYSGPNKSGTKTAFNRLFSDHEYSEFLDTSDMSNFWGVGGGVSAQVTEAINLKGLANYMATVQDTIGGVKNNKQDLGVELELIARYNYSKDLYFEAGYAHIFGGKAFGGAGGATIAHSGTSAVGNGVGQHDGQDYVYVETGIKF